jgi:SAM-dependent methyltransferase
VGVDISSTSIQETEKLKRRYELSNLELMQLPVEQVEELDRGFDQIICTGVLHHLPEPEVGLRALSKVLKPDGALHLMVYATYGRAGIHMIQEYARLAGVGDTDGEINDFANTLMSLPRTHPLAPLLAASPDFRTRAGLADALLNPQERAYSVPEFMDLIASAGLRFRRWLRQAPYLPQCGRIAETPHSPRLEKLPLQEQFGAMELLRGTMLRHSAIIHHQTGFTGEHSVPTNHPQWQTFIPIRSPGSIIVRDNLPPGADAVIINHQHTFPDLVLPVDRSQLQIYETINGSHSMGEIISNLSSSAATKKPENSIRSFFQQLWWYDHVVFDTSASIK